VTFLLDVNVLIRLIDPTHIGHDAAHRWFAATGAASWATCPLTESGVLRIVSHPQYPNSAGSPAAVAPILAGLRALAGHTFWKDEFSLVDWDVIDPARIATSRQVTDSYLLALAVANRGQLATFDRRLSPAAVRGGARALCVIEDRG
jgi:toxin-antitoxin system PIN domain toxin